jgi:hypothetical protein
MSMVAEIQELVENYRHWLKEKTSVRDLNGSWVEITTPYLDRHNDALQIYAKRSDGGFLLSDDHYIISDLEASGCNLDSPKRKDLLTMTLNGFGVKLNNDALETHATADNFPSRKHNLIQAMLAVNDLFYLAQPVVETLFHEDVAAWLDESNIRYTPNVKFTGQSGYDQAFDFVIPKSQAKPERIVQAINRPSQQAAAGFIFRWTDTRGVRSQDAQAYTVLNDMENPLSSAVADALGAYGITPVAWSSRYKAQSDLTA